MVTKSYGLIEKTPTALLGVFLTMVAVVGVLVFPGPEAWITGFTTFPGYVEPLGGSGWYLVAVSFGWIGAGFAPTVPDVWYAKDKGMGLFKATNEGRRVPVDELEAAEIRRLWGWRRAVLWQNVVASVLFVTFSLLLWVATTRTLHPNGIRPSGFEAVAEMAGIFTSVFGGWSGTLFLFAISLALFTSMYAPAYGISRFWEGSFGYMDGFERFGVRRTTFFRLCLAVFVAIPLALNLTGINPLLLFSVGGILFAPIIALLYLVALYLLFSDVGVPSLRPHNRVLVALALIASFTTLLSSLLSI